MVHIQKKITKFEIDQLGIYVVVALAILGIAYQSGFSIQSSSAAIDRSVVEVFVSSDKIASDTKGDGTKEKPFRSLTRAIQAQLPFQDTDHYVIKIASQPYVLSGVDVAYATAKDPMITIPRPATISITTSFSNGDTIILPNPGSPTGVLRFNVEGGLEIFGLYFTDFRLAVDTKATGTSKVYSNYFIPGEARICDQLKASYVGQGTLEILDNKFVMPTSPYEQECGAIQVAAKLPVNTAQINNNYFEIRAVDSPYRVITTATSKVNIERNKFVAKLQLKDPLYLIGILATSGSKPVIKDNYFDDFAGTEVHFTE